MEFFFLSNLTNLGHFFHEKSFVSIEIIFVRSKLVENLPTQKKQWNNVFFKEFLYVTKMAVIFKTI
jgi:hypothetical protein